MAEAKKPADLDGEQAAGLVAYLLRMRVQLGRLKLAVERPCGNGVWWHLARANVEIGEAMAELGYEEE